MNYRATVFVLIIIVFAACKKNTGNENTPAKSTPATSYNMIIPEGFPKTLNIPADNPMTVEGIQLGRYLYYDGRLSGRSEEAFASPRSRTYHGQGARCGFRSGHKIQ